jgi:hypothetical protein
MGAAAPWRAACPTVKGDDSALVELCLTVSKSPEKRRTANFWHERFAAQKLAGVRTGANASRSLLAV